MAKTNPVIAWFWAALSHWRQHFSLDVRSLALLRICLGLLILADLAQRSGDLVAHYTDAGVLPRAILFDEYLKNRPHFSLHLWGGSALFQAFLFVVAGAFALALTLGYRTRLAIFVSWLLLVSLHNRNHLIVNAGDSVLRQLLFWSWFLPLGARFSLDQSLALARAPQEKVALKESQSEKSRDSTKNEAKQNEAIQLDATKNEAICTPNSSPLVFSWGSAGFIFQLGFIYFFSALYKLNEPWTQEFSAVYYSLRLEQFAKPLAYELLRFPELLKIVTIVVLQFEFWGPILILLTSARAWPRTILVAAFIAFHAGLGLCLDLGLFPVTCSLMWLALLPSAFWNFLARHRFLGARRDWSPVNSPIFNNFLTRIKGETVCLRLPIASQALALFFLIYISLWNARGLYADLIEPIFPEKYNALGRITRTAQGWTMFRSPAKRDGWFVIAAKQRGGAHIDLFAGGAPLSWQKPRSVLQTHRNSRWRKYSGHLVSKRYQEFRLPYAKYLSRRWNNRHATNQQVVNFDIYFMREQNNLDGSNSAPKKIFLLNYNASANDFHKK